MPKVWVLRGHLLCSSLVLRGAATRAISCPLTVIRGEGPDKDRSVGSRDFLKGETSRLNALVRNLKYLPLLRVEPLRLCRRYVESSRVKVFEVTIKKVATSDIEGARSIKILVEVGIDVESIFGDLGRLSVSFVDEHVPKRRR